MSWGVKRAELERELQLLKEQVWGACQINDLEAGRLIAFGYLSTAQDLDNKSSSADAYRALAYIYFVQNSPAKQEAALKKSIEIDCSLGNVNRTGLSGMLLIHHYLIYDKDELAHAQLNNFGDKEHKDHVLETIMKFPSGDNIEMLPLYYLPEIEL